MTRGRFEPSVNRYFRSGNEKEEMVRRTGKVAAINPKRGMVGVFTEDDGFTIIELLSEFDLDLGDEMAWANGYGLGSEIYQNLTKGTQEEVYVQNHAVNKENLRAQLLL